MELADARSPARAAGGGVIFVRVPEAYVIGRIDGQHAVVAPAPAGMGLVTAACSHDGFALPEII